MHGQWQQYISFVTWVTRGFTQRQQHHKKSIRLDMAMIPNHPCNRINHESFREKKLSKLHLSGNSLMFQCHSNQYRKLFTYLTDTMKMYESLFYWRLWFIPPPPPFPSALFRYTIFATAFGVVSNEKLLPIKYAISFCNQREMYVFSTHIWWK